MPDVKISDLTDGTAVAAGDLVEIERPGSPNVSRRVPLGTAAGSAAGDFATAAQGDLADSAVQPGDLGNSASRDVGTTAGTVAAGDDSRITGAVPSSRTLTAGTGLTGGGDLSANRTFNVSYGATAGTAAQGNDSRITGALQASSNLSDVGSAATAFGNIKQNATTSATGVIEQAVASEFRADTAGNFALTPEAVWDAAEWVALTDGTTISIALSNGFNFGGASQGPLNLGGNRTLGAPSSVKSGQSGVLMFGASSSTRTLTLNAAWLLMDGVETGPYSITTSQVLFIAYFTRGTTVYVSGIFRRAA